MKIPWKSRCLVKRNKNNMNSACCVLLRGHIGEHWGYPVGSNQARWWANKDE